MAENTIKQGIIVESNAEYHGYQGAISKSMLSKFAICPAYYKWTQDNPSEPTEDLVFGSGLHKWVLEEATFFDEFIIQPATIDRRTKQGKLDYEEFLKQVGNKQILTQEQFDTIIAMKETIMQNDYARVLLNGEHEKSFYFQDELTQEWVKARPDCYRTLDDNGTQKIVIVDLKSCRSAMPKDFQHDIVRFSYDLQCALYNTAVSKVLNVPIENIQFIYLAIEKKPPFLSAIYVASQEIFDRGMQLYRQYLGTYKECKDTNNFWGLNGSRNIPMNITLPNYLLLNE